MKENERLIMTGLTILFLLAWFGFTFHTDPNFAGSALGGFLAVVGSFLMLLPLFYMIVKRIKPLKKSVTKHSSMRSLLSWHIYAGVLGPILVMIHTGHKFNSLLGISLTAMTLIVVLSGFIGRNLLSQISRSIKEKKKLLDGLTSAYHFTQYQLETCCQEERDKLKPFAGFFSRLLPSLLSNRQFDVENMQRLPMVQRALMLCEAVADVEYSIKVHDKVKRSFTRWLKLHIVISIILYLLLAGHIFTGIYFGIRWFQ